MVTAVRRAGGQAGPAARFDVRHAIATPLALAGVAAYNWWIVVLFHHGWLRSTDSFFSDLEVSGAPHAAALERFDVAAGLLLLAALLVRGARGRDGPRAEWKWFVLFAAAATVGGLFPFACAEGTNASCRSREWHFALPAHHYVHVLASAVEFLAVTFAVFVAWRRTRGRAGVASRIFAVLAVGLLIAYVPLAVAYFTDRLAALVEPVFFVAFSAATATEVIMR